MQPSYLMTLFAVYAFLWGAVWGSFLNVAIWRLPEGMSLSKPDSHCPSCKTPIRWYDNVPILAWLWLRGKCRSCGTNISFRYPAIELFVAVLGLLLWLQVAGGGRIDSEPIQVLLVPFMLRFYFFALLVTIAFIDLDHTIIPHELTIAGMVLGIATALLLPKTGAWVYYFPLIDIWDSVIGLVAGFGLIALIFYGYAFVTGRVGLGGGDATMLAFIGANLGWQSILFVLLFSALQGLLAAVVLFTYEALRGTEAGAENSAFLKGAHRPEFWDEEPQVEGTQEGSVGPVKSPSAIHDSATQAFHETETRADSVTRAASEQAPTIEAGTTNDAAASHADVPISPTEPSENDGADASVHDDDDDGGFMKLALPFGPFLALAALEYVFIGEPILRWFTAGMYP